jgi:hypothetical protein
MVDQHQVNSIIATAIYDCRKDHPDCIDPEEAKQIAKCIVEALEHIPPASNREDSQRSADERVWRP